MHVILLYLILMIEFGLVFEGGKLEYNNNKNGIMAFLFYFIIIMSRENGVIK